MTNWAIQSLDSAIEVLEKYNERNLADDIQRIADQIDADNLGLFRTEEVEDLLEYIYYSNDEIDFLHIINDIKDIAECSYISLSVIKPYKAISFPYKMLTTLPSFWIDEYINRKYYRHDHIIQASLIEKEPFYWAQVDSSDPAADFLSKRMSFLGISPSGYSIPSIVSGSARFVLSLSSASSMDIFHSRISYLNDDLVKITDIITKAFIAVSLRNHGKKSPLTESQLLLLKGVAQGLSRSDLRSLDFVYGSLENVEKSTLRALGATTLTEAVSIASRIGVLHDDHLRREEVLDLESIQATDIRHASSDPEASDIPGGTDILLVPAEAANFDTPVPKARKARKAKLSRS